MVPIGLAGFFFAQIREAEEERGRVYEPMIGIVTNNRDPQKLHRVRVKLPTLSGVDDTAWAPVVSLGAGKERGWFFLPEVGDEVLVVFEHGDIGRPLVIGTLWNGKDAPPYDAQARPGVRAIVSRAGSRIELDDDAGTITIEDAAGKGTLTWDGGGNKLTIASQGDVVIGAGGDLNIVAGEIEISATHLDLRGGSAVNVEGSQVKIEGKATLMLSGGVTQMGSSCAGGAAAASGEVSEYPDPIAASAGGSGGGESAGGASDGGGGTGGGSDGGPDAGEPPTGGGASDQGQGPVVDPDAHTIDVSVVTHSGTPAKDVFYELALPEGGTRAGTTGAAGVIAHPDLPAGGTARLTFPAHDERGVVDQPSEPGRIKYVPGGVDVPIDGASTVELQPLTRRGRLTGMLFDLDKTFLLPRAMNGIRGLVRYYEEHPGLEVLVNGHADTSGDAAWNLRLSEDRGDAIVAFLTDDVDAWLPWYDAPMMSQRWGTREDQHMLSAVGYYAGPVHGVLDAATQDAARRFQADQGLTVDGVPGPETRRALVGAYMGLDGTSLPAGTPLTMHGCGEHHPAVPTGDGVVCEENRRVEIFLFEGPVDPPAQPTCPAPGCPEYPEWVARMIEDVDFGDAPPPEDATLEHPRWEAPAASELVEVTMTLYDGRARPCASQAVTITAGGRRVFATTDGQGVLRCRVPQAPTATVRYQPPDHLTATVLEIELEPADDEARLANLGYVDPDPVHAIFRFQADFGVPTTGRLDDATRARLREVHDGGA